MIFQYVSDIHIDHYKKLCLEKLDIQQKSPYLIIAGDIGCPFENSYEQFISFVAKKFELVFIISGNHEYYNYKNQSSNVSQWIPHVDKCIKKIASKFKNVIFLQNSEYKINDDLTIFGGTMWTTINNSELYDVQTGISDYQYIPKFTPQLSAELHKEFITKLTESVSKNKNVIVVSHHMPSFDFINERYRSCSINSAFASDVPMRNDPKIVKWIFGHTHAKFIRDKFVCNPLGYPRENVNKNFNETFTINIPTYSTPITS